jgi:hypothetical protein
MSTSACTQAVIARPDGESWHGRYVYSYGAPADLGPILHRLARERRADIDALTHALLDEHYGWNHLDPHGEHLGNCRCHDPEPAAPTWPDTAPLTPGQCARARYAYILTAAALHIEVRVDGDWHALGRADYTREPDADWFDELTTRARDLTEAAAWANDLLN